jgi:triphosphoribosyl-dephospho-CoA synthase
MQTQIREASAKPFIPIWRPHPHDKRLRSSYPSPELLARLACQVLVEEVELTPKPGLVDRRGAGSHHDLSLQLFVVSAGVLQPFFRGMAEEAQRVKFPTLLRQRLGMLGRDAEAAMLEETGGANTHRGAIWSLGLLIAGAAMQQSADTTLICGAAAHLAGLPDTNCPIRQVPVEQSWRIDANFGARKEACDGFPHVITIGLPALHQARSKGMPEDCARIDALLAIMVTLPDTCILQRGGTSALSAVQQGAQSVLNAGGSSTPSGMLALHSLEEMMHRLWVSPGGSADLLGATLFLDRLASTWAPACD